MDKRCITCLISKPLSEFYSHREMKDGTLNQCKVCLRRLRTEFRNRNIERIREADRKRHLLPKHQAAVKRYQSTERGRKIATKAKADWAERNKNRRKAQWTLSNAIRDKRIFKKDLCERCGSGGKLEAHHPDYSKPLEVLWVHDLCHKAIHKEEREARRKARQCQPI
jgi:hypothetical protein